MITERLPGVETNHLIKTQRLMPMQLLPHSKTHWPFRSDNILYIYCTNRQCYALVKQMERIVKIQEVKLMKQGIRNLSICVKLGQSISARVLLKILSKFGIDVD